MSRIYNDLGTLFGSSPVLAKQDIIRDRRQSMRRADWWYIARCGDCSKRIEMSVGKDTDGIPPVPKEAVCPHCFSPVEFAREMLRRRIVVGFLTLDAPPRPSF